MNFICEPGCIHSCGRDDGTHEPACTHTCGADRPMYEPGSYCDRCGDMTHEPGDCQAQNLSLGRCSCPTIGYAGGVPLWMQGLQ